MSPSPLTRFVAVTTIGLLSLSGPAPAPEPVKGDPWVIVQNKSKQEGNSGAGIEFSAPDSGWIVGDHTDFETAKTRPYIQRWDGAKWSDAALGDLANREAMLTGVAAVTSKDAWATGIVQPQPAQRRSPRPGSGLPFRDNSGVHSEHRAAADGQPYVLAHWDGQKWGAVDAPKPPAGKEGQVIDLERVGDQVWAVGLEQKIDASTGLPSEQLAFIDRYSAGAVRRMELPKELTAKPSVLLSVTGSGPDDVWLSGAFPTPEKDTPFAAHWNGKAFTVTELPVTAAFPNGWNADQVAVMGGIVYVSGRSLYTEETLVTGYRFDGKTWSEWTGRGLTEINDMTVRPDGGAMVLGGWPAQGSNISQYASFDGKTWTSHEQPPVFAGLPGQVLSVAYQPGTDRAMAVGYTNDDSEWGGAYYVTANKP